MYQASIVILFTIPAVGCFDDSEPGSIGEPRPYADVFDDGTELHIVGCAADQFIGCQEPGPRDVMNVMLDGQLRSVPPQEGGAFLEQAHELFRDGPFHLSTTSPADRGIALEMNGLHSTVVLPPPVHAGTDALHVSRSVGPIRVVHDVLSEAVTTQALVESDCGQSRRLDLHEQVVPGEFTIDLGARLEPNSGACTHHIHVDQTLASTESYFTVTTMSIAAVTVTSDP